MARIALAGGDAATRLALGALGHEVVDCEAGSPPSGCDLLVVDGADPAFAPALPCVRLVPRGSRSGSAGGSNVRILEKPFELEDMHACLRALLDVASGCAPLALVAAPAQSGASPLADRCEDWLAAPMLPPATASAAAALARLGGLVWVFGEPGTGTSRVASALARALRPDMAPLLWLDEGDAADAQAAGARTVLIPDLDLRSPREQKIVEHFLAGSPQGPVIVTSDDAETAVEQGRLTRSLLRRLSAATLRLPPLRERESEIEGLALAIAARVAGSAFGCADALLEPAARALLLSWNWPGNYEELEAVVARSVLAAGRPGLATLRLDAGDIRLVPDWKAARGGSVQAENPLETSSNEAPPRRAVVVALDAVGAARAARASGDAFGAAGQTAAPPAQLEQTSGDVVADRPAAGAAEAGATAAGAIEAVLASFAHDIHNPMATIKTFASLQAAVAADGEEGELARLAAEAGERIGASLALMQRFAELPSGAERAERIDVVEVLGEAIDAAEAAGLVEVAARGSLWCLSDADLARFVADALVAECAARGAGSQGAVADVAADGEALELRLPLGSAAVDSLGRFLEGSALPWRLALAREAARRGGGDLELSMKEEEMRLRWQAPVVVEEAGHVEQTGRTDRRRRSRSS